MKIAYLIGRYPAVNHGYLLEEILHLRTRGIEVHVASIAVPDRPDESLSAMEVKERDRTFYIKSQRPLVIASLLARTVFRSPVSLWRGLRFAWKMAPGNPRSIAYHLIYLLEAFVLTDWMTRIGVSHVHVSFSGTVGVLATKISPISMSFGIYGYGEVADPATSSLALRLASSSFVRCISRHLRSLAMIACPPEQWSKLEYVPLGIDPQVFQPCPYRDSNGPFQLICVGRLSPEKGQRLLIAAAAVLKQRGADFTLHLVGTGPDQDCLQAEVERCNLTGSVVMHGSVNQETLLALYARSDAFVLASLYEGIPMVLMEAMALEIPCIAPRITGIPELIHDGIDGLLFTPADIDELAEAILRLISSPELRRSLGRRARERVLQEYSAEHNAARFAQVLCRRLPETGGARPS